MNGTHNFNFTGGRFVTFPSAVLADESFRFGIFRDFVEVSNQLESLEMKKTLRRDVGAN